MLTNLFALSPAGAGSDERPGSRSAWAPHGLLRGQDAGQVAPIPEAQGRWIGDTARGAAASARLCGSAAGAAGMQRCSGCSACRDAASPAPAEASRVKPGGSPAGERRRAGEDRLQAYCWCKLNQPVTAAYKEVCVTASAPLQRQPRGVFIIVNRRGCPV